MHPDDLREAARGLRAAEAGVRVLRAVAWPPEVRAEFLARGARELPRVEYRPFDPAPVHAGVTAAMRRVTGDSAAAGWLSRAAEAIATSAEMVAAAGTRRFFEHSTRLFGMPTSDVGGVTPLELARQVDGLATDLEGLDLGAPPAACHLAGSVAERLRAACAQLFGDEAPEVVVVDELSANALAGPRRIQVRRGACFTDRDAAQLVEHEVHVHVCTSLNGGAQVELPLLASSHAGTTRTQEGLAVFAELVTGSMDLDRFRRLADRVLAIQMAIDGADFLDVHRWFLERGLSEGQAFENARRVFRGGRLDGGAPFTKDVVYLDGLLRVTRFLKVLLAERRADCLPLLFAGKLDLEDVPALACMAEQGLCRPPRYLPPWAADRRFLVAHLGFSTFLQGMDVEDLRQRFRELLAAAPRVAPAAPGIVTTRAPADRDPA